MRIIVFLSFLFLRCFSFSLELTDEVPKIHISLKEAIELAAKNSYAVKASLDGVESAIYQKRAVISTFFPQVNIGASLAYTENNPTHSSERPFRFSDQSKNQLSVTVNQPIIQIIPNLYVMSQKEILANIQKLGLQKQSTQAEVVGATSYLNVQLAKAQKEITQANLETVKRSLQDAELLLQTGSIYKDDYLRIELQYAQAKQNFLPQDVLPVSVSADHRIFDGNLPIPKIINKNFHAMFRRMLEQPPLPSRVQAEFDFETEFMNKIEQLIASQLELGYKLMVFLQTYWFDFVVIDDLLTTEALEKANSLIDELA